ncbi:hypothetical protein SAMN05444266_106336 [Chitinophaga jiangningensis]|uniref:Uncharacterized protein n=1 Tax=Chitinophaga jiangningensis TaxID=1419482 RepID=A0A1M7FZH8_9BACT|nr:hypothetical protein [Chitinophaga jiangningensis]SHM09305.1 hypothetical protein SAMN05444266_106336 [Chitinophaga jiangningensis]
MIQAVKPIYNNRIPNKEYVTATIIHEIIHGYFKIEYGLASSDPWDHGEMAGNDYFNKMKYALKEVFPNLSETDAQALVWIGLQDTDKYKDKPLSEKNAIEYIAMNYRVGLSGTKCN